MKTILITLLALMVIGGGVVYADAQTGFIGLYSEEAENDEEDIAGNPEDDISEQVDVEEDVAADEEENGLDDEDGIEEDVVEEENGLDDEDGIEEENGTDDEDGVEEDLEEIDEDEDKRSDVAKEVHRALTADPDDPDDEGLKPGDEGFGQSVAENARSGGADFGQRVAGAARGGGR